MGHIFSLSLSLSTYIYIYIYIYNIQCITTFPLLPDIGWPLSASTGSDWSVKLRTKGTAWTKTLKISKSHGFLCSVFGAFNEPFNTSSYTASRYQQIIRDSVLLGYDAAALGNRLPMFRGNVVLLKRPEPTTQWYSVISHNSGHLKHIAVRTSQMARPTVT